LAHHRSAAGRWARSPSPTARSADPARHPAGADGLLRPERIWRFLLICTLASSLGAVLGYVIGYALWGAVGLPLVEALRLHEALPSISS